MKEIGEKLKEARESMGVTIEEAATDLKLRPSQLENIEEGNREAFKDVFYLKMFIKNYSKYLGLDYDEMVEEFNEYLFDFTSKISIEDIKKAEKEQRKKEKKLKTVKIASPYTVEKQQQKSIPRFLIIGGIALVLVIIVYVVVLLVTKEDEEKGGTIVMEGVDYCEFA
ncbi:MAG: helix-turn-helix domain-containing protein [Bacilli bacterium]|nr:helix-turn-helix domain-containing protein [Bacilli bacterium]